jgi:hypothetical protein
MWIWGQSSGILTRNGSVVSRGYSGKGRGKNNPALQGVVGVGPVPRGDWKITERYNSPNVGPYALVIKAVDATPNNDTHDATGRGAFRIHGDSIKAPGTASRGCIILPRAIRELIWTSGDRDLRVIE